MDYDTIACSALERVWARLYEARLRHPILVVRAVTQLCRQKRGLFYGRVLLAHIWPAIKRAFPAHPHDLGQYQFKPDEITAIGRAWRAINEEERQRSTPL